jgi:hypothetical protein
MKTTAKALRMYDSLRVEQIPTRYPQFIKM